MSYPRVRPALPFKDKEPITLFDPQVVPFVGLYSKPNPTTLGPGQFQALENWRVDTRVPYCRNGITKLTPSAFGAVNQVQYDGMKALQVNGVQYLFTHISYSNIAANQGHTFAVNPSTGAATKLTASSGIYGDTRTYSGGANFQWEVVRDKKAAKDYVVMMPTQADQYPLVIDVENALSCFAAPVNPPEPNSSLSTVATFPKFFQNTGATMPTYTNSGVNLTGATNGASPDNNPRISITTSVAAGDTAKFTYTSAVDLSACPQFVWIWESGYVEWLSHLKIEISEDDVTYYVIHDPSDAAYTPIIGYVDNNLARWQVAFSLDRVTSTNRDATKYIRFTWVGSAPSASQTMDIYMMAGSGTAPAYAEHQIAYFNSGSRCESGALAINNRTRQYVSSLGGRQLSSSAVDAQGFATSVGQLRIAFVEGVLYNYSVQWQNTASADLNLGVDTIRFYRSDYGEDTFSYVGEATIGTYSGSWSFSSGSAKSVRTYTDSTAYANKTRSLVAPNAYNISPPKGTALLSANGRLFIGGYQFSGGFGSTSAAGFLYISEADQPFRFCALPYNSTTSATVHAFQGGEYVISLAAVSTSVMGVQNVFVFGTGKVYSVTGKTAETLSRINIVSPHGTKQAGSVATYREFVTWMDNLGQIRILGPNGMESPSLGKIENKLKASWPDSFSVYQEFFNERLYCSYSTAQATQNKQFPSYNTRILVYDLRRGEWDGEDTTANTNIRFDQLQRIGGTLYFYSTGDHNIYQHETGSTDAGSAITVTATTGQLTSNWNEFSLGRPDVVVTSQASTWTFVHSFIGSNSGSQTYTVNLNDTSNATAWLTAGALPTSSGVATGWAGACSLTGTFAPGSYLYGWRVQYLGRDGNAKAQ